MIANVHADVSLLGLFLGLLLGALLYLLGQFIARETGERLFYVLGIVAAVAAFVVLGFDLWET